MGQRLAVFLLPEREIAARIQAGMDDLAQSAGGPVFPAHLTVYAGSFGDADGLLRRVADVARWTRPLCMHATGLDVGDRYTKCLFLRLEPRVLVEPLTQFVGALAETPHSYVLDPHLSLLYGTRRMAEHAIDGLQLPVRSLRFDRIAVNRSEARSDCAEVVARWTRLFEAPLAGGGA